MRYTTVYLLKWLKMSRFIAALWRGLCYSVLEGESPRTDRGGMGGFIPRPAYTYIFYEANQMLDTKLQIQNRLCLVLYNFCHNIMISHRLISHRTTCTVFRCLKVVNSLDTNTYMYMYRYTLQKKTLRVKAVN